MNADEKQRQHHNLHRQEREDTQRESNRFQNCVPCIFYFAYLCVLCGKSILTVLNKNGEQI